MSDLSLDRARAHFELLERARAGTLTGAERAALVVLLDRLLVSTLLDEEDEADGLNPSGPPPARSRHVSDAYRALVAIEAEPAPPSRVGGADVRRLRRAP